MAEKRFGRIIVEGDAVDLALATDAYVDQKMPTPVGDLEPRDFPLQFRSKREFLAAGLVIPGTEGKRPKSPANPKGGIAAYGYTLPRGLQVNSSRSHDEQIYVLRHEPFHPIVSANLTKAKRAKLLPLVIRVAGTAYQNRLNEVLCDAFVELFWGEGSILDKYYGDIADDELLEAWQILTAPEANPEPVPVEPPAPLPAPDPRIAELEADNAAKAIQIAQLTTARDALQRDRDALLSMRQADVASAQSIATAAAAIVQRTAAQT